MAINEFEYYQPNEVRTTGDCVIRAFSKAMNWDWEKTYNELCKIGLEVKDMPNCKFTQDEFCKRYGFIKHIVSNKKGTKRGTVRSFCKEHPTGTYILDVANHRVCVVDGKFYDLDAGFERLSLYAVWEKLTIDKISSDFEHLGNGNFKKKTLDKQNCLC